jgi:hypothetical protein
LSIYPVNTITDISFLLKEWLYFSLGRKRRYRAKEEKNM